MSNYHLFSGDYCKYSIVKNCCALQKLQLSSWKFRLISANWNYLRAEESEKEKALGKRENSSRPSNNLIKVYGRFVMLKKYCSVGSILCTFSQQKTIDWWITIIWKHFVCSLSSPQNNSIWPKLGFLEFPFFTPEVLNGWRFNFKNLFLLIELDFLSSLMMRNGDLSVKNFHFTECWKVQKIFQITR